jgi:hypothetical protein
VIGHGGPGSIHPVDRLIVDLVWTSLVDPLTERSRGHVQGRIEENIDADDQHREQGQKDFG